MPLALKHWRLVGEAVLIAILAIIIIKLKDEQRHSAKLQGQIEKLVEAGKRQQEVTKVTVREVARKVKVADRQAERIEKAPTPANCQTAPEILGADL